MKIVELELNQHLESNINVLLYISWASVNYFSPIPWKYGTRGYSLSQATLEQHSGAEYY